MKLFGQREKEKHGYGWMEPFVLFRNTLFYARVHPSGGCQVLMRHVIISEVHVGKKGKGERTYYNMIKWPVEERKNHRKPKHQLYIKITTVSVFVCFL